MGWDSARARIDEFLKVFLEASQMEATYEISTGEEPERPRLRVEFRGPEAKFLVARHAELLHALESVAVAILRLEPEEHDHISFDAENYKAGRAEHMQRSAQVAVSTVKSTGRPYAFAPMNSRERRMLHLELVPSGLRSASSGEAARRYVVLYPADEAKAETNGGRDVGGDRLGVIRSAFRPR